MTKRLPAAPTQLRSKPTLSVSTIFLGLALNAKVLGATWRVFEEEGVLVIDEQGDRKWGKKTAHVGKSGACNCDGG